MASNSSPKRKPLLPLHIDTTSFISGQQKSNKWKRWFNKRHIPIILLLLILSFSFFLNVIQHNRRTFALGTPELLPPLPISSQSHAIVIAGHAIYKGPHEVHQLFEDSNWILEPYQKGGQIETFVQHIKKGIELLRQDKDAILIFSGGETRLNAGPVSESFSYWNIAQILIKEEEEELKSRMITEEFAKDSYENLLFSVCRFSEMTGNYPLKVTVVGFEFKRKRFETIHREAIRYPFDQFEYIGIDPQVGNAEDRERGEFENSLKPFTNDLYGCHGSLKYKKIQRNPFRRRHAYTVSCPALASLINYCPSDNAVFGGHLPWK
ncbi:hypothetical protein BY458DRAFT_509191 [Sporodiniella umbellata]|nr:hypothetical protein BY458DRAFT_509191 [Sporodiniella umbellata]